MFFRKPAPLPSLLEQASGAQIHAENLLTLAEDALAEAADLAYADASQSLAGIDALTAEIVRLQNRRDVAYAVADAAAQTAERLP